MKVLVICEESQTVCKAFRDNGHEAFSLDIVDCSGGHPEWHIKRDFHDFVFSPYFVTCDGHFHRVDHWDLIIAHPPCTDLCVSGARHFEKKRNNNEQYKSILFFLEVCRWSREHATRSAIENPVGIIGGSYIEKWFPEFNDYKDNRKCDQIIQPYMFGDPHRKTTCLWLNNLPELTPTNIVEPTLITYTHKDGTQKTYDEWYCRGFKTKDRAKHRSKTFEGIARAMADQWGVYNGI